MKVTLSCNGDFSRTARYFERLKSKTKMSILDKYGRMGVEALRSATPVNSGETAASWEYKIEYSNGGATLSFNNTHTNNGVNIAIILQYGHGTGTGGYVQGRDYINPAIQPVFDKIADDLWKEVTNI